MTALLRIEGLHAEFPTRTGRFAAVDGVDLAVQRGRTLGIVGEAAASRCCRSR